MKGNFEACLKPLLVHEGGNDDDPQDPGGRTSRGITQSEYDHYRDRKSLTKRDVWLASDAEVKDIYLTEYWNVLKCDDLPAGIDYAVFDFGVNSGNSRAAKELQLAVYTTPDGEIGPNTIKAAQKSDAKDIITIICDNRLTFLHGLKTWPRFGKGWTTRVEDVRALAVEMVEAAPEPERPSSSFLTWLIELIAAFMNLWTKPKPKPKGAPWVAEIRKYDGITEKRDYETILSWRADIAKAFPEMAAYANEMKDPRKQAWCGYGLGAALARVGIRPPFGKTAEDKFMWADSYSRDWGVKLDKPIVGCIGVRTRNGGGHVTTVVKVQGNKLWCRGFNQEDSDNVEEYALDDKWTGFYWPKGYPIVDVEPDISNAVQAGKES